MAKADINNNISANQTVGFERSDEFMNDTRNHILNVSSKLFLQKSFKEVTMKEIVEQTGMSKGAFYHHFKSKEQLFMEVINNLISSMNIDYSKLSKDSLYEFYHDYIDNLNNAVSSLMKNGNKVETALEKTEERKVKA